VKFIHKQHALERGHISPRQLIFEVELHKLSGAHENLIAFYGWGEDDVWLWIAMEYAAGGDLFDKIGECWTINSLQKLSANRGGCRGT